MKILTRYRKAIVAVLGALIQVANLGLIHGTLGHDITIAIAVLTALGVHALPNDPPAGQPADAAVSERGHADVALVTCICWVVIALIFVLWAFGAVPTH